MGRVPWYFDSAREITVKVGFLSVGVFCDFRAGQAAISFQGGFVCSMSAERKNIHHSFIKCRPIIHQPGRRLKRIM